jgi:DNA-directed RNA polymerase omega subunit
MRTTPADLPLAAPAGAKEENKFRLVVLAHQRAKQLQCGAKPRVDTLGHKFNWVAMREVTAGMISWDMAPKPGGDKTPA